MTCLEASRLWPLLHEAGQPWPPETGHRTRPRQPCRGERRTSIPKRRCHWLAGVVRRAVGVPNNVEFFGSLRSRDLGHRRVDAFSPRAIMPGVCRSLREQQNLFRSGHVAGTFRFGRLLGPASRESRGRPGAGAAHRTCGRQLPTVSLLANPGRGRPGSAGACSTELRPNPHRVLPQRILGSESYALAPFRSGRRSKVTLLAVDERTQAWGARTVRAIPTAARRGSVRNGK